MAEYSERIYKVLHNSEKFDVSFCQKFRSVVVMERLDEIHIKLPSGTWSTVQVSLQTTVLECKHAIEKSFGVPYEIQRLFYDNAILPDSEILSNRGIQPGDTIEVWEPGEIEILHISGFSFRTWVEP